MVGNIVNYQNWSGMTDRRYGYGAMLSGFLEHSPVGIGFSESASSAVYFGVPESCPGFVEGAHRTLFTMWETSVLSERWIRFLTQFDLVVVPCEHNRVLFAKHHDNVKVVPLGVDQSVWFPKPDKVPNAKFRFGCGGSLWERKGLDLVVRAFNLLDIDAELHIKVAPHMVDQPAVVADPRVVYHYRWMPEPELVAWTQQNDCWVAPSRGEGFGLMGLQAIACGIPTILSQTSGHLVFERLAGIVVPTVPVPARVGGSWDEVDVQDLADAMLEVFSGGYKPVDQSAVAHFSWKHAANMLVSVLPVGVLLDNPKLIPCQPWVTIRVKRAVISNVAGCKYNFVPDTDYEVPDEVEQVLSQANFLV